MKNLRDQERIAKGFANHKRIAILRLLKSNPDSAVMDISEELGFGFQVTAQHVAKLFAAGLISKRQEGVIIRHAITQLGRDALRFLDRL